MGISGLETAFEPSKDLTNETRVDDKDDKSDWETDGTRSAELSKLRS